MDLKEKVIKIAEEILKEGKEQEVLLCRPTVEDVLIIKEMVKEKNKDKLKD